MIGVQDIRNGTAFLLDGSPWVGIKYEHIKMGRGSATIKIKMKNLLTGATVEKSFINSARVEEVNLTRKDMEYLYQDGEKFVFMDPKTFDQVSFDADAVGEKAAFLSEGVTVAAQFWEEKAIDIDLPPKMEFTVVETDPGIKGNSAANMYKQAKLANGVMTRIPLFVNEGEKIVIDTRDGSYCERVKE